MKYLFSVVAICCLLSPVFARPTPKAAAKKFIEKNPKVGDWNVLRMLSKFHISRPVPKAFEPKPARIVDLMMPKPAKLPKRQSSSDDFSKIEFFAGYSYMRFAASDDGVNLHGFHTSVAVYPFKNFGFVGDFSGLYDTDSAVVANEIISGKLSLLTFMGGPRVRGGNDRVTAFVHGMVGGARLRASFKVQSPGLPSQRVSESITNFAAAAGGGVDIKLSDRISWRIFQADYVLTRFLDESQHSVRASTGLVFK